MDVVDVVGVSAGSARNVHYLGASNFKVEDSTLEVQGLRFEERLDMTILRQYAYMPAKI